jgi:signal transduction histidine kinase
VERLPAEHPAASSPPQGGPATGRASGEPEGHPGGVGTMTLQRPPEPSPDDVPAGATLAPPPARESKARGGLSPRHWKVRTKLAAVLLVPAIAFLVLASINMAGQIGSARDFGRGANVAEFGRQASALVHELQAERDIAAGYVAAGREPSNQAQINEIVAANQKLKDQTKAKPVPAPNYGATLAAQQHNVDSALAAYRSADAALGDVGSQAQGAIDGARDQLKGLSGLRIALTKQLLTEGAINGKYTAMITSLLNINRQIGQGTGNTELNKQVAGLTALGDVKETLSQERALLYSVASNGKVSGTDGAGNVLRKGGQFQFGQQQDFSSVIAERLAALQRLRADATTSQITSYDALVNGQAVLAVKRLEDSVTAELNAPTLTLDPQQWYSAATTYLQAMRVVETGLLDQVVSTTRDLRSDAQRQAITTGVIIAAILVIAFLTSLLIARSMIGPLRRLQAGARDVAQVRLPEAIARLQRPDAPVAPDKVEPIGIDSRDEIGQVATTFDQLHQRAVELASEQAGLRRNVNDMFVNLSRRSQGLVERQLKLIDELETGEQDPDQLANLFKLDHLATRMRRNSENLLVLAGEDAGRRWGRPIPLVDVLRAATSEVEQYHRIQLTGVPDVEVMGHAVNHLVHLVAELLENATVFSSPESKVLVHSQRLSDGGAMVEIEDRGIGMSAHEVSDANERLAHPPEFDVSVSRMMGLYVVGRLATRHGITVRLRQAETGGVSAFVRIPIDVLANRFDPRSEDGSAGPAPMVAGPDGRAVRPPALAMPPAGPGPQQGPGPRPIGPGPAADLPRRPIGRPAGPPDQPVPPGSAPLPRRTPAQAAGTDGASAGGADGMRPDGQRPDGLPVNGAMPANGVPTGMPMLPPVQGGPGQGGPVQGRPGQGGAGQGGAGQGGPVRPGRVPPGPVRPGPVPPGDQPGRPALPARGGVDAGSGPRPIPPLGAVPARPGLLDQPYQQQAGEERTPIFEQLQSEWFRQRPASTRPAGRPGAAAPATPAAAEAAPQQPAGAPATEEAWASPADEGWRAAERLLEPTSGGTTRAGLPMRVPQAHLMPGGADVPSAAPPQPARPAYRSPEAVRSRLASYHQGVRRGRHADRAEDGDNRPNPSELVQQSQEKS